MYILYKKFVWMDLEKIIEKVKAEEPIEEKIVKRICKKVQEILVD